MKYPCIYRSFRTASMWIFLVTAALVSCGKGPGPEPNAAGDEVLSAPKAKPSPKTPTVGPKQRGRGLVYDFQFLTGGAKIDICADGPFVRIDETWTQKGDLSTQKRAVNNLRIVFDKINKVLTVINLDKNAYVKVNEARMADAQADLEKGKPISLGDLGAKAKAAPIPDPAGLPMIIPLPSKTPKRKHPSGCAVFERDLPLGLREETCFAPFDEDLAVSEAFSPLVSLASFTSELNARVPELDVVSAAAEAVDWDLGIPASQFKFGDSPFEEDALKMEAWDRTFTLAKRRPCTLHPKDLDPAKDATEEFGLLPWETPFIVTALPD